MSHIAPLIPDNAPFSQGQRAWLNGFVAALVGSEPAVSDAAAPLPAPVEEFVEEFPWHDPALPLDERLALAEGKPLARVLMAAMAQLDCGQCGYLCRTYAEAIAGGAEKGLARCVPGGRDTARALKELMEGGLPAAPVASQPTPTTHAASTESPRPGRLARVERLNRTASEKDTRHVVFDLEGAELAYEVGDSLGVHAANCPETVDAVIELLGGRAGDEVDCPDGSRRALRYALTHVCDIGRPSDLAIEVLASRAPGGDEGDRLQALAEGYPGAEPADADLLDLLVAFPSARPPIQELVSALGVLQPRLYSIASSPKVIRGQAHLTVAAVRYERRGRLRKGIASIFLAERATPGAGVPVFVRPSPGFRLPQDPAAPIIMIGPGTGVAPFRAFLQERRAIGATGRNWLFFGDQRRELDFLYRDELEAFHRDGLLTRLDTAFSRDQAEKVYVQHRMRAGAKELWAWLQEGATIYVCGDAQRMARDVDLALAAIIAKQGGMPQGAAKKHLAELARAQRYQRDVY